MSAIANYKTAIGQPEGLAELMVFYCEFGQALKAIANLPNAQRRLLMVRLDAVCRISYNVGYAVGEAMSDLFADYDFDS